MQYDKKIIDKNKISSTINKIRINSKRIVFTNGCFDVLHAGHVKYLEIAKSFGDILIVGLNSDDSIKKIS